MFNSFVLISIFVRNINCVRCGDFIELNEVNLMYGTEGLEPVYDRFYRRLIIRRIGNTTTYYNARLVVYDDNAIGDAPSGETVSKNSRTVPRILFKLNIYNLY